MWPKFRCKKAERERDLADEANRLFKQEFGDKIESLQTEVEQLRRQRWILEQELKKGRDHPGVQTPETLLGKTPPQQRDSKQHIEDIRKELESVKKENDTLRTALEEKTSLSSSLTLSHEDEQNQSLCKEVDPSICTMCENQDSLTSPKSQCKNCSGVFCENCMANELPLPSSINPEHVCDVCYSQLLEQYSSSPS